MEREGKGVRESGKESERGRGRPERNGMGKIEEEGKIDGKMGRGQLCWRWEKGRDRKEEERE